jgi:hypothetical protein
MGLEHVHVAVENLIAAFRHGLSFPPLAFYMNELLLTAMARFSPLHTND